MRRSSFVILLFLLAACASTPSFDTSGVDRSLTPQRVAARPQGAVGKNVQWGGTIVDTTNLQGSTQMEVLAYPLDADGRPRADSNAQGRFIFERAGYLEPATYADGRLITVVGKVTGARVGKVGESDYTYPVVAARQLYLWPAGGRREGARTYFGIGVGSGDSWGSGVGIGF
jgi:outer membrane lipoprotein